MFRGEVGRRTLWLVVDDEVDLALTKQRHILRAMMRDLAEAERLEDGFERARRRCSELDEFEPHEAHRVLEQIRHACLLSAYTAGSTCPAASPKPMRAPPSRAHHARRMIASPSSR